MRATPPHYKYACVATHRLSQCCRATSDAVTHIHGGTEGSVGRPSGPSRRRRAVGDAVSRPAGGHRSPQQQQSLFRPSQHMLPTPYNARAANWLQRPAAKRCRRRRRCRRVPDPTSPPGAPFVRIALARFRSHRGSGVRARERRLIEKPWLPQGLGGTRRFVLGYTYSERFSSLRMGECTRRYQIPPLRPINTL